MVALTGVVRSVIPVVFVACSAMTLGISDANAAHGTKGNQGATGQPRENFKILMNYELGMHCTGFEFAYCCVLPVYNSILTQIVKTEQDRPQPLLMDGDPNNNTTADVLGRETVVRDLALDDDDNFVKYVMRYWHDAQPRNDGRGKEQTSTLISNVEGNSLLSWNTVADAADLNPDGSFKLSDPTNPATDYDGVRGVVLGNGSYTDTGGTFGVPIDNYQNVVWNHLYIKEVSAAGVEGVGGNPGGDSPEADKFRLGLHVDYPTNYGPGGHPMQGLLTYSGDSGTVVYTQMKVLEDLPIMLTSPHIWEALGLPLTPFEDSIDFFGNPGLVDEDSVRPYVKMQAQLYYADCDGAGTCTQGDAVLDNGEPVIGFGTAPIDIPNCERCHSAFDTPNSPNISGTPEADLVQEEIDFWNSYYDIDTGAGDSDWYSRLKGAAISILSTHDAEHGTSFTTNYPGTGALRPANCQRGTVGAACALHSDCDTSVGAGDGQCDIPQNTRIGHESVICQKCHADNVIAVVKSAYCGPGSISCADGELIPPLTEAIHYNHREMSEGGPIEFSDSLGRSGGCQGCHPAHRSDGELAGYPIDLDGNNFYAGSDNRSANGGCFVGRDVHSNPMKDIDGAETPSHLNPVGEWLRTNVALDSGSWKGIWCTNCHSQAGQQVWKAENVTDLVHAQPGATGHVRQPVSGQSIQTAPGVFVSGGTLSDVVAAVNASLGTTTTNQQFIDWLDPKDPSVPGSGRTSDQTSAIWAPNPGLCDYVDSALAPGTYGPVKAAHDANVAVVAVSVSGPGSCPDDTLDANGNGILNEPADVPAGDRIPCNAAQFHLCGSYDTDGDFNVAVVGTTAPDGGPLGGVFCTTPDCLANATPPAGTVAVPVPFSAATDGRDHWLASGEPHCADCHAAPYVEQSGNINAYPPFNYPRKASLMRYSKGHQGITCQGCHESIHGLYPVTPTIDTTSYAQAAHLNNDDSHGPIKCAACHDSNAHGVNAAAKIAYNGVDIEHDFDAAVSWMHTYTDEADPRDSICLRCHEDNRALVSSTNPKWVAHAKAEKVSRRTMDKVENLTMGHVSGDPDFEDPYTTLCVNCHTDKSDKITTCGGSGGKKWKKHMVEGRASEKVWTYVSNDKLGTLCGW
jgi:hypothetical protein